MTALKINVTKLDGANLSNYLSSTVESSAGAPAKKLC
jgi:hypothetical protein